MDTEDFIETSVVEMLVKPREHRNSKPSNITPFVIESLKIGSDIIIVQGLQETYKHIDLIDPETLSYKSIEMKLGQIVYHAIRPLEAFNC